MSSCSSSPPLLACLSHQLVRAAVLVIFFLHFLCASIFQPQLLYLCIVFPFLLLQFSFFLLSQRSFSLIFCALSGSFLIFACCRRFFHVFLLKISRGFIMITAQTAYMNPEDYLLGLHFNSTYVLPYMYANGRHN